MRTRRRWLVGMTALVAWLVGGEAGAQPRVTCRAGYLDFEAVHGLEGVRAALRQAVEQNDPAALTFLSERLAEVIGQNVEAALQVATWADTALEPELSALLQGLRNAPAVKDPRVVAKLFTLAEGHSDPDHQAQALVALETQERFDAASMDRLAALAKQETRVMGVAMHAARTLGRVMENDFRATGTVAPYMARLLDVARTASKRDVRSLAVEMGGYPAARMDAEAVKGLAGLMKTDPDAGVREMAALVLSTGEDTGAVLAHYREAFGAEKSLCVRLAILRYTLRAGGEEALPQVREYARVDRRLEQDAADFKALYGAGHMDFDRVWPNKQMRHRCPEEPRD